MVVVGQLGPKGTPRIVLLSPSICGWVLKPGPHPGQLGKWERRKEPDSEARLSQVQIPALCPLAVCCGASCFTSVLPVPHL